MNRQKLLLSALLAIFAIAIGSLYWRMPRQKTVASLTYGPGAKAKAPTPPGSSRADDKKVRLYLLENTVGAFSGFKRNIFQPLFQENRITAAGRPARTAKPVSLPPPGPATLVPQPTPVQRDMAQFTFIGFLKKENRKTIFLTGNNEIFLVKKGDTIAGKYQVVNITDEMLSIRSLADGWETIIPLTENRPLQVTGQ
jgi:hypothetical protein